jgi:glycine dehydrogenase subunit 1
MTAATIYMSLLGPRGLARVAAAAHARTQELAALLAKVKGVRIAFEQARFHELVLQLDRPVSAVLRALQNEGILGGYDTSADYPELGAALLVCATETKTHEDLQRYAQALERALRAVQAA